jgi:predicted alpha/beta-fold hydrolase
VTKRNEERTGIDLVGTSFIPDVKDINVPTLVVQNSNDPYLNRDAIDKFYNELRVEKEMLWVDLVKKRAAGYDYLATNPEKVLSFFDKHLDSQHQ